MFNEFLQVGSRSQNIISKANAEGNPGCPVEHVVPLRKNKKAQIY